MNDVITVSKKMQEKIQQLDNLYKEINLAGEEKAKAVSDYEKHLAKTVIRLRNNDSFNIDGNIISGPPVSIIDRIAKGLCWQESMNKDLAETKYKCLIKQIDIILAQLNALQSINKYLKEV